MKGKQSCNVTFLLNLVKWISPVFQDISIGVWCLLYTYIGLLLGFLHEELASNSLSSATLSWQDYSASDVKQMAQRPGKFHHKASRWMTDFLSMFIYRYHVGLRISGIGYSLGVEKSSWIFVSFSCCWNGIDVARSAAKTARFVSLQLRLKKPNGGSCTPLSSLTKNYRCIAEVGVSNFGVSQVDEIFQ